MQGFYRVHYTKARLSRIYPSLSDACGRCYSSLANHVHMYWSCFKFTVFYLSATFALPPTTDLCKRLTNVIAFTRLLACKLILLDWKLPHPPSHIHWFWELLYYLKPEKLRFSLKGFVKFFFQNCLLINAEKTQELVLDFRTRDPPH